jgi:hypothetical protein
LAVRGELQFAPGRGVMDPEKKVFSLMVRTIPSSGHDTAATVVATATVRSSDARSKSDLIFLKGKCLENSLIMASVLQSERVLCVVTLSRYSFTTVQLFGGVAPCLLQFPLIL